jgi:hypothetical protein
MIVTRADARRIIESAYRGKLSFRISTRVQIGARMKYESMLGQPTLAWQALDKGSDSAVRIGCIVPLSLLNGGSIDWTYSV